MTKFAFRTQQFKGGKWSIELLCTKCELCHFPLLSLLIDWPSGWKVIKIGNGSIFGIYWWRKHWIRITETHVSANPATLRAFRLAETYVISAVDWNSVWLKRSETEKKDSDSLRRIDRNFSIYWLKRLQGRWNAQFLLPRIPVRIGAHFMFSFNPLALLS